MFLRRAWTLSLLLAATLASQATAWVPHIVTKGNKFFYSDTGLEFRMKGIAYYPRPNAGELYEVGNYDWAADEHRNVWEPHLKIMQELGVNTLRLYSVDPSKSHDEFMCACSNAGIYVLIGMVAPCKDCAVPDLKPPACYPDHLVERMQMVYNAFAVYDNTLGFSVGNENNLQTTYGADGTTTAPCVKALVRDVRNYAASCSGSVRQVPIGLDIADTMPRAQWLQYYDCVIGDNEFTRAEWIGFNPYVECDPSHSSYSDSAGLRNLMKDYADTGYGRIIMLGEFGCNLGDNTIDGWEAQRSFYDALWMNEEVEMTKQVVGGNVFEFSTERLHVKNQKLTKLKDAGKYGIGYFSPDNCDHDKIECVFTPYPEFDNLKKHYTSTKNSTLKIADFKASEKILTCPSTISSDLPKMPDLAPLACTVLQPVCNAQKANTYTKDSSSAVKVGEKKKPTNVSPEEETVAKNADQSTASDSTKKSTASVSAATVSHAASHAAIALVVSLATWAAVI